MTSSDFEMTESVIRFTQSDLRSRVRTAQLWGVKDAEKLVAKVALDWAKKILEGDDG